MFARRAKKGHTVTRFVANPLRSNYSAEK